MEQGKLLSGRYQIGEAIGQGATGDVYRGLDTRGGETVAVKALKADAVALNARLIERFRREGQALRQLNHPNIVKMLDFVDEGGLYIIMEYVEGGSLRDLLDGQPQLPLDRALSIGLDLSDAITRAHRLNIIHRDLKPANVLIAADGTPRLTDFGLALFNKASDLTPGGIVVGTYAYLSPEGCMAEPLDERGDIWSFGVMLFEMLAGRRPFTGDSVGEVVTAILTQPVHALDLDRPDAPDALLDLIFRMLDKNRDARIPSVRMVGAELEAIARALSDGAEARVGGQGLAPLLSLSMPPREHSAFATPTPSSSGLHNLPAQATPFVGRQHELAEVDALLRGPHCRLVTIFGPGGMGKTRLSLESAARQLAYYPHGTYFVPLAQLQTPDQIAPAIAESIGFQFGEQDSPGDQLLAYLREKSLLLVIDNFEHVMDGVGLVSDILDAAPGVRVIASSRARLNLGPECVYEIGGLSIPQDGDGRSFEDSEAAQLFVTYARRAQPNYALRAEDQPAVARICRLLGGMPLGIELAAAWVRVLPPDQIADELESDLDFLNTSRVDVPERQRSMRAVFEYSWDLLSEPERDVLARLTVFQRGFSRQAANVVAGASPQILAALVDKSLLGRDPEGRFAIHNLIRQLAEEKLEASPQVSRETRDRHCAYFTAYLTEADAGLKSHRQLETLAAIDPDFDNVRAAWLWAAQGGRYADLEGMVYPLTRFVMMRSRFQEGEDLFLRACELLDALPKAAQRSAPFKTALGLILTRRGVIATRLSRYQEASDYLRQSLEMAQARGDETDIAFSMQELGNALTALGHPAEGQKLVEESIERFQALNDTLSVARGYYRLGFVLAAQGRLDEAVRVTEECLALSRQTGDKYRMAGALGNLGSWYLFYGRYGDAIGYRREALDLWRELGNSSGIAHSLAVLGGMLVLVEGNPEDARPLAEEGLALSADVASKSAVLYVLSWLSSYEEDYQRARELAHESLALAGQSGNFASVMHANHTLGIALFALGQPDEAWGHILDALKVAAGVRSPVFVTIILPSLAMVYDHRGQSERAAELLALAEGHPASPKGWLKTFPLVSRLRARLERELSPDALASASERGRGLDWEAVVGEALGEGT